MSTEHRLRPIGAPFPGTVAILVLAAGVAGCAPDMGLGVGDVQFTTDDVRGLPDAQIDRLVSIAAVGLATARGEPLAAVAPALAVRREDARILGLRRTLALERMNVSDAAVQARYASDPEYELTVRHLVVLSEEWRSDAERAEARTRAEAALALARAGRSFPELAGEVSEEPGAAERGGLLAPGREGTWVEEFWAAANALGVGEISDVVQSEYGFHVIRLEDRELVPFADARDRTVAAIADQIEDRGAWEAWVAERSGVPLDSVQAAYPAVPERARGVLLAEADRRGIGVAEADEAALVREWESRMAGWAGFLGFEANMTPELVADHALSALGSTSQNVRLARDEIAGWSDVLLAAYPVEHPDP